MSEMGNECAFCKQPVIPEADTEAVVVNFCKVVWEGDILSLKTIEDKPAVIAHQDCWESRNSFAPARRRVLQIGGVNDE